MPVPRTEGLLSLVLGIALMLFLFLIFKLPRYVLGSQLRGAACRAKLPSCYVVPLLAHVEPAQDGCNGQRGRPLQYSRSEFPVLGQSSDAESFYHSSSYRCTVSLKMKRASCFTGQMS